MVIRHDLSVPWRRIAAAVRQPKLEEVFCVSLALAAATAGAASNNHDQ
jgi:hypothetical protein